MKQSSVVAARSAEVAESDKAVPPRRVRHRFHGANGATAIPPTLAREEFYGELEQLLHTPDLVLSQALISQAAISVESSRPFVETVNAAMSMIDGIAPRDHLEVLLAVQMVATHTLAMGFLRRATTKNRPLEYVSEQISRATKLFRAYSAQAAALERHRGYGQQHVTVEHVHVNAGGNAIVGSVRSSKGEGE